MHIKTIDKMTAAAAQDRGRWRVCFRLCAAVDAIGQKKISVNICGELTAVGRCCRVARF